MAASLSSAQDATGSLNLGSLIGGKVKNALAMSAEERKAREEEIKLLQEKVDAKNATQEDIVRLEQLEGQDTERKEGGIGKSFFAKAMGAEFGGDRRRRLAGTFSKDPDATQDPSLSKEERFSALLDKSARPGGSPLSPATPSRGEEDDSYLSGAPEGAVPPQQSGLDKILETIKAQYSAISSKVNNLGSEEQKNVDEKSNTNAHLARVTGVLESLKQYFNRDNELKEGEQKLEQEKVDIERDAQADVKTQQTETGLEGADGDNAGLGDTDTLEEQKERNGEGGLLDKIFGGFKGMLGKVMGGGKKGGSKGATQYTKPVGPQPMNSATPWAAKSGGDRGGSFGQAGFTPRMPSAPTTPVPLNKGGVIPGSPEEQPKKLNAGSRIASNPNVKRLKPGSSVIPLNRNNGLARTMKQAGKAGGDVQTTQKLAEGAELVPKTGGGLLLSLLNQAMKKLGGIGSMFKGPILGMARGVTDFFGLPQTMLTGMFGGSPSGGGQPDEQDNPRRKRNIFDKLKKMLGMKTRGNPMAPGTGPTGSSAAPNLSGTGVVGEVDMNSIKMGLGAGQTKNGATGHAEVGLTTKFGKSTHHGRHHNGVDIGTSGQTGYMVGFKRSGTVEHAKASGTYGNLVIIKDDNGVEYYFGHLKNINPDLKVGSAYTGQTIGEIGNTGGGLSNGEHLHFEKRPPGSGGVDPLTDVGLLDIGKQTTSTSTSPGDAKPVELGNLGNQPSPITVTPDMQRAAPELSKLIQQSNALSKQSGAQPKAPVRGLSSTSVYNPSLGYQYYFQY